MSSDFCHVTIPPPSPSTPYIRGGDSLEDDADLMKLMEDFMRATELQISLKRRIESFLEKKKIEAQAKEEEARLVWMNSQARSRAIQESVEHLKDKMKLAEDLGRSGGQKDIPTPAHNPPIKTAFSPPLGTPQIRPSSRYKRAPSIISYHSIDFRAPPDSPPPSQLERPLSPFLSPGSRILSPKPLEIDDIPYVSPSYPIVVHGSPIIPVCKSSLPFY
jgi:hypothetical protein